MSRGLINRLPEGLPFERRYGDGGDTDAGWALYLEWVEAPSDVMLAQWANALPDERLRALALVEGAENDWTRRKMAFYRHTAEISSCQAAAKASKSMLRVIEKWDKILDRLMDDVPLGSDHYTDAEIERLRVVTEAYERIVKSATGNKFITAVMVNNNFNRQPGEKMNLAKEWDNDSAVLEQE